MGGGKSGGSAGYDYWGANVPSNYAGGQPGQTGRDRRGAGGGDTQQQSSRAPARSGQYDTLNQALAADMALEAAKGFGKVAAGGLVAPNIFTPTMALGNAARAGYKTYKTQQGEQTAPEGTPTLSRQQSKVFGPGAPGYQSPLDDDEDDGLGSAGTGDAAGFGGYGAGL